MTRFLNKITNYFSIDKYFQYEEITEDNYEFISMRENFYTSLLYGKISRKEANIIMNKYSGNERGQLGLCIKIYDIFVIKEYGIEIDKLLSLTSHRDRYIYHSDFMLKISGFY